MRAARPEGESEISSSPPPTAEWSDFCRAQAPVFRPECQSGRARGWRTSTCSLAARNFCKSSHELAYAAVLRTRINFGTETPLRPSGLPRVPGAIDDAILYPRQDVRSRRDALIPCVFNRNASDSHKGIGLRGFL